MSRAIVATASERRSLEPNGNTTAVASSLPVSSIVAVLTPVRMPGSSPSTRLWPAGAARSRSRRLVPKTSMAAPSAASRSLSKTSASRLARSLTRQVQRQHCQSQASAGRLWVPHVEVGGRALHRLVGTLCVNFETQRENALRLTSEGGERPVRRHSGNRLAIVEGSRGTWRPSLPSLRRRGSSWRPHSKARRACRRAARSPRSSSRQGCRGRR